MSRALGQQKEEGKAFIRGLGVGGLHSEASTDSLVQCMNPQRYPKPVITDYS